MPEFLSEAEIEAFGDITDELHRPGRYRKSPHGCCHGPQYAAFLGGCSKSAQRRRMRSRASIQIDRPDVIVKVDHQSAFAQELQTKHSKKSRARSLLRRTNPRFHHY